MLLNAAGVFEFLSIAQNTMQRGKKLFSGEFFLVVVFRDLHHQKHAIDIENL